MTPTPTLFCVGSGLAPRYKLNTLQALALPRGARIQFRYDESLVEANLCPRLETNSLVGAQVLLGYVDCNPVARRSGGRCWVIPYREALLVHSARVGSFFALQLEVRSFRLSDDLQAFQQVLTSNSPHWGEAIEPQGNWCLENPAVIMATTLGFDTELVEYWQRIVKQLSARPDYCDQPYFYMIEGLYRRRGDRRSDKLVDMAHGDFPLVARARYELRLVHSSPGSSPHSLSAQSRALKLEASTPAFSVSSNPSLTVDSPYDVKIVDIKTGDGTQRTFGSLHLCPDPSDQELIPDLYLTATVRGDWLRPLWQGASLGALLASTQLVTAFSKGPLPTPSIVVISVVVLGLATGLFVSFGMRKPL